MDILERNLCDESTMEATKNALIRGKFGQFFVLQQLLLSFVTVSFLCLLGCLGPLHTRTLFTRRVLGYCSFGSYGPLTLGNDNSQQFKTD